MSQFQVLIKTTKWTHLRSCSGSVTWLSDQTCMFLRARVMTEISPAQGKNITKPTISDTQKPPAMESILWLFLTQESDWKWEMSFQQLLLCEKLLQLNFSRSTSALGFRARWSRGNLKFLSEVKTLELFSNCSAAPQLSWQPIKSFQRLRGNQWALGDPSKHSEPHRATAEVRLINHLAGLVWG